MVEILQFSRIDQLWQNFSSEIAYAIGFGYTRLASNYNCKSFPANYSLILHTAKVFHLERFAMYGNFV